MLIVTGVHAWHGLCMLMYITTPSCCGETPRGYTGHPSTIMPWAIASAALHCQNPQLGKYKLTQTGMTGHFMHFKISLLIHTIP